MGRPNCLEELFTGRHFDREVIILCVRWHLRFKLSLRDRVEMMAERSLSLANTTIMRWVRHCTPVCAGAAMPLHWAGRGASTRHTSISEASGVICTEPSIEWDGRSTSG